MAGQQQSEIRLHKVLYKEREKYNQLALAAKCEKITS
jgi:hypothetical protein